MALHTGNAVNGLQPIGDVGPNSPTTSTATVTNGQVIHVAVDSSRGVEGDFSLVFDFVQLPLPISIRMLSLTPDTITLFGDGLMGRATRLESSTNLVDWTTELFNSSPVAGWSPTIPRNPAADRIFFRFVSESTSTP